MQDGSCDHITFRNLAISINECNGCYALWSYFQHWLTSDCVLEMINIANFTTVITGTYI